MSRWILLKPRYEEPGTFTYNSFLSNQLMILTMEAVSMSKTSVYFYAMQHPSDKLLILLKHQNSRDTSAYLKRTHCLLISAFDYPQNISRFSITCDVTRHERLGLYQNKENRKNKLSNNNCNNWSICSGLDWLALIKNCIPELIA